MLPSALPSLVGRRKERRTRRASKRGKNTRGGEANQYETRSAMEGKKLKLPGSYTGTFPRRTASFFSKERKARRCSEEPESSLLPNRRPRSMNGPQKRGRRERDRERQTLGGSEEHPPSWVGFAGRSSLRHGRWEIQPPFLTQTQPFPSLLLQAFAENRRARIL